MVLEFLLSQVNIHGSDARYTASMVETSSVDVSAAPISIDCKTYKVFFCFCCNIFLFLIFFFFFTDVTNVSGNLEFWCQWPNGGKFVASAEVAEKWPLLLLNFLESKIRFEEPVGQLTQLDHRKGCKKTANPFFVGAQMGKEAGIILIELHLLIILLL